MFLNKKTNVLLVMMSYWAQSRCICT